MKKLILMVVLISSISFSQIYEPEGLNMPGAWNGWTNPPATGSVFGSYTQVSGGQVTKISTGTTRWQTKIKVAPSGGDITGGSYEFLFTSGPSGSPWNNKWANVSVSLNTLQTYTFGGSTNNSITVSNDKWYTVNWKDAGYVNTQAIFMETSGDPITISSVTDNHANDEQNTNSTVSITLSNSKSAEEKIFVRYTTNNWTSSNFVEATGSGTLYSASIGTLSGSGTVKYYVLTTTVSSPTHADADLQTIKLNNNSGSNYSYDYDSSLPIELISFIAISKANIVELAWQTATEVNNHGFEVEKKSANSEWKKIGFVEGKGTTNNISRYSFVDNSQAQGKIEYRLKQIDRTGEISYSKAIEINISQQNPQQFQLMQNYPNPFNPSTTITYTLTTANFTTLKIYDALGKEITTLANEMKDAGTYTAKFDASQLSSGLYFAKLQSGNMTEMKKLVLMK